MAVDDATIQAWLQQNAGASDADIRSAMDQYGVDTSQMARATGMDYETMQSRYDGAGPAPAPAPVPAPAPAPNGLLAQPQQYTDDQVRSWIGQYYDPTKGDWSVQGDANARLASDMQRFGVGFDQMGRVLGISAYGGMGTPSVENLYARGYYGVYNRNAPSNLGTQTGAERENWIKQGFDGVKFNAHAAKKWMMDNNVAYDEVGRLYGQRGQDVAQWANGMSSGLGNSAGWYGINDNPSDPRFRSSDPNGGTYWSGGFDDHMGKLKKLSTGVDNPNSKFATGGSATRETRPVTGGVTPLPGGPGVTSPGGQSTGKQPVSDDSIRQWLSNNPNASDRQIRAAMDQTGVTPSQLARATGMSEAEISRRYFSAGSNIPTSGPGDTSPGGPTLPGTGGGDPVPNPAGPNWTVDDPQTVEGRLNNLLKTDDGGTYTNPVIRQAVDRALQAFNGRGLLNSSMAQQAAQEAAISKATEIAKSDAETYAAAAKQNAQNAWQGGENTVAFERDLAKLQAQHDYKTGDDSIAFDRDLARLAAQHGYTLEEVKLRYGLDKSTQEANRDETLRASYRSQVSQANVNYTTTTANINNSNMTAEQKAAAMQIAAEARDSELTGINEIFAQTPRWRNEWSAVAVRVDAAGVASINSESRLLSIIADPAQKADVKDAARLRLTQLRTAPPPAPAPAPAPAPGGNNY